MELKRVIDLPHRQASKIYSRIKKGTLAEHFDNEQYLCYDAEELKKWKPRKVGRKPKKETV